MAKISIITPCYNSAEYIGRTIESVRAQTLANWEHIVVDDGSTDGSAKAVESFMALESRLHLVRQPNGQCAKARNTGFQASSSESEYLLFLDADDCLEPQMLERVCHYLDAHPQVGMAHCGFHFIDSNDHIMLEDETGIKWAQRRVPTRFGIRVLKPNEAQTPFSSIFVLAGIIPSLAVFRRSVYEQTPCWDEDMAIVYEDVSLYLHMSLRSEVHYLPEALIRYRRHPAQETASEMSRVREATQQAKFYAKWNQIAGLPPEQQAMLDKARAFRESRIIPYSGLQTGATCLRNGEWRKAIRFYGGAIRRYRVSVR